MSTFFSTSFKPQPHIRQEGFHLDNEGGGLGATGENHEGGHSPPPFDFGRTNVMDFTDELASLMGAASPHPGSGHGSHHGHDGLSHSHHESHLHGGHPGSHHESHLHGHHHNHHQHNQSHERSTQSPSEDVSSSYRTHNIFDMGVGGPSAPPSHFNSTVLPLNSSMRYENPPHDYQQNNTPSPPLGNNTKERSRSRPPTGGGVGPQRTARTRRNNSISSTSPPPHIRPAAQAIVIPGVRHTNGGTLASPISSSATSVNNPWAFTSSSPTGTSTSEFTLPTPDSLHHHHHSNSLSHSMHTTPHLSSSVGFSGYFGSTDFGTYHGQHNGGHTPSTSLPTGGIHSQLSGSGASGTGGSGVSGHQRTNSAAASTTPSAAATTNTAGLTASEKQQLAVSEKRRRRRESHNAVERRRRDNINEKISELATLIPESLLEGGSLPATGAGPILPSSGGDSPSGGVDLLSPTSPTGDSNDLWGGALMPMKKEDDLTLDSPVIGSAALAGGNSGTNNASNGGTGNNNTGVVKANKGMILRKSVEYIRYLQQIVQEQDSRNRQLEMELRGYKERNGESLSPILPAPAFEFQSSGNVNGSSAYAGAGYGGSFRMLDSMPEDDTELPNHHQKSMNKSRDSTPLTEDDQPDEDDPNDPDVEPPASLKKASVPTTKRTTRGRKAAEAVIKTRRSKKHEEDIDMGGSDHGEAMDV